MTASHVRALSRGTGALLGAIAVLVAGCTAAGGGSGSASGQAADARHSAAVSRPGQVPAHRTAGSIRPASVKQGGGPGIARASSLIPCAPPLGIPVAYGAGVKSGSPAAAPTCLCCAGTPALWCACGGACCGCGSDRWPPRSHTAWLCCPSWLWPRSGDRAPLPADCGSGCTSLPCPMRPLTPVSGPAGPATGSARSTGGVTANATASR